MLRETTGPLFDDEEIARLPLSCIVEERVDFQRLIRAKERLLNSACETACRIAPFDIPVLISGESGTGKELLARSIHYGSPRAEEAFVIANCGALPDTLLESELFGYKRGAFTGAYESRTGLFEQADEGTIFLDEIGETSPAFQVKLLRVLQDGEIRPLGSSRARRVNVRVISATNRDLEQDLRSGRFREDLYYRLNTFSLHIPPLRARVMDIPLLARHLLQEAVQVLGKPTKGFSQATMQALSRYPWPGNVRELRNEIMRMLALSEAPYLEADLLSPRVWLRGISDESESGSGAPEVGSTLKEQVEKLEKRLLLETLARHRGNKSRAAQELGLSRVGLRAKLLRYGLEMD